MATAAPARQSRWVLHTRGTWSAREDRWPSTVWLGVLWAGMIAGFGLDLPFYLHATPRPSWILHAHAAVFTIWMLVLTTQGRWWWGSGWRGTGSWAGLRRAGHA